MTPLERLFTHRLLDSPEAVAGFEAALSELVVPSLTAADVERLLGCFTDRAVQFEVMWGLVHALETLPDATLVASVLTQSPKLVTTAPEWLELLVVRQLNDQACSSIFVDEFQRSSAEQQVAVRGALQEIARSSAAGSSTAAALLASSR